MNHFWTRQLLDVYLKIDFTFSLFVPVSTKQNLHLLSASTVPDTSLDNTMYITSMKIMKKTLIPIGQICNLKHKRDEIIFLTQNKHWKRQNSNQGLFNSKEHTLSTVHNGRLYC